MRAEIIEAAVRRLENFGPFRSEHEAGLWPRMAGWIDTLALPKPGAA